MTVTGATPARAQLPDEPTWVPPRAGAAETMAGGVAGAMSGLGAPVLAPVLALALRGLGPRPRPRTRTAAPCDPGDPGWFGPGSVAWRVHADVALAPSGLSAFMLQALHPRAMAGVWDHSAFGGDFLGRTRRTAEFVQGVVYGSSAEADAWCRRVQAVHRRVVGTTPDGRPYDAADPELVDWVHCTEYLAIAAGNRRFAAHPMTDDELDAYVAETARVGEAMGVASPPRSWAELDAAMRRHRPSLAVGEQAVLAVRFLRAGPGLPAAARPAWALLVAGATAVLPPVARRLLRLAEPPVPQVAACRALVRALGRVGGPPPQLLDARRRVGAAPP
ncbi:MAG TPA: oxygenase MpaB family protein [Acidimicrobiales bacterium]|nr:oxygenase MpaB family protein [Acidimicrobiales bacterium]